MEKWTTYKLEYRSNQNRNFDKYRLTVCDDDSQSQNENLTFCENKFWFNQPSAVTWPIRSLETIIYSVNYYTISSDLISQRIAEQ